MLERLARVQEFGDCLHPLNLILVGGMLLTVGNILLRQFGSPFGGTAEMIGYVARLDRGPELLQRRKAHVARVQPLTSRRDSSHPELHLVLIGTVISGWPHGRSSCARA